MGIFTSIYDGFGLFMNRPTSNEEIKIMRMVGDHLSHYFLNLPLIRP